MKKGFLIGILLAFFLFLFGFFTNLDVFILISGGIGLGCLLVAGLLSGVFISGDKIRANFTTETSSEGQKRYNRMLTLVAVGAPNFLVAILLTMIS
ncbi:hypothetical protein DFO70_13018 [Cytobacillus firmus]|uniref:Uncharacterized protein n=2 Tax=Cytobacillus TaxID=2675230 RepID=A0A366JGV0_CYTFI|nr:MULTISPECIES: DUF5316 domain-containing protein [Cytobacillus]RBP86212.1 hypothetical protein DFO70_13018 [Cytobacillus firmus]TDX42243.1 hypothetical protein DFO72_107412 [Cytobacillus oceanisediminis]